MAFEWDEIKTLLAEPGAGSPRAIRDATLLALAYGIAARGQELCDFDVADIRRSKPMTVHDEASSDDW